MVGYRCLFATILFRITQPLVMIEKGYMNKISTITRVEDFEESGSKS